MNRLLPALAFAALTAGCAAGPSDLPCAAPEGYGYADGPYQPVFVFSPTVERDLMPGQRRRIYARLAAAGLEPGPVPAKPGADNGYITPRARKAIAHWQEACRNDPTGHLTERQVRVLLEGE